MATARAPIDPEDYVRISKALADPQRCQILEHTASARELSCMEIVAAFPVTQATTSHHLKELHTAGLLSRRKDGQFVYYRFQAEVLRAYLHELARRTGLKLDRAPRAERSR